MINPLQLGSWPRTQNSKTWIIKLGYYTQRMDVCYIESNGGGGDYYTQRMDDCYIESNGSGGSWGELN